CVDIVLACGYHFNLDTKEFVNVHGELIAKLDATAIAAALRIPEIEESIVLTLTQAQALFDKENEKYKAR
ncbi:hypothetical protein KI387_034650, partial [Taxus chinensis]